MKPSYLWVLIFSLPFVQTASVATMEAITTVEDAPGLQASATVIGDIRVVIDGLPSQQESYADMATRIITIHPGDRLTSEAIQASIDALTLSNRFASIHVDSTATPDGETLI